MFKGSFLLTYSLSLSLPLQHTHTLFEFIREEWLSIFGIDECRWLYIHEAHKYLLHLYCMHVLFIIYARNMCNLDPAMKRKDNAGDT